MHRRCGSAVGELQGCQSGIKSAFGDECLMFAFGDDAAVIDHDDAVGLEHGGKEVAAGRSGELPGAMSLYFGRV